MKKSYIGALSIMFAAFLWAVDGVIFTPWVLKLGMSDVPIFVFMLHATSSLFLSYFFFKRFQELKNLDKKDWFSFILVALFGGALGTMSIVAAISIVYSQGLNISVVLLLQKLQPIFAIFLAFIVLKERLKKNFYLWSLLALLGSYLLTFGFHIAHFSLQGMFVPGMLSVLAAFSFGASTVFSKRAIEKVSFAMGTSLRFLLTTILMFLLIVVISILHTTGLEVMYLGFAGFKMLTWSVIGVFLLIAFTTGGMSNLIYYYGLKKVTASKSTIYELFFPFSSILLEFLLHGKILSLGQWFGVLVVLFSVSKIVVLKNK
ncbi:MAG: protein of unknown function DUF6 transmembrane [uncultured bacterium]|nr:MAG: protein of unknown function DUF6 transmembrane [uncultured bacterium]OGH83934.1 MAG: hypothetical protein A2488_00455 [Candidatus Magasanikbacteria bacterium RIFOXYC12_FULL_32_21b]HAO52615.1 EamA family transporter [Candidatus Magasanikbacteria bacterium]